MHASTSASSDARTRTYSACKTAAYPARKIVSKPQPWHGRRQAKRVCTCTQPPHVSLSHSEEGLRVSDGVADGIEGSAETDRAHGAKLSHLCHVS